MCGGRQRFLLYQLRNAIIQPFGETAQQVFARISALRDSLDGPQVGPGLTGLLTVLRLNPHPSFLSPRKVRTCAELCT